jgi:outer membrane lipoprotein-sorting protein
MNRPPWDTELERCYPVFDERHIELRADLRTKLSALAPPAVARRTDRWKTALNQGKELIKRPIPRLIVVTSACLLIAGAWLFVSGRQSAAQAFNKFVEKFAAAKSARYQVEERTVGEPTEVTQEYYLAPGRFRSESQSGDVVQILDQRVAKFVTVNRATKRVNVVHFTGEVPRTRKPENDFNRMRELLSKSPDDKDSQYKRLGEKVIDGRRVVGFQYDSPTKVVTLWGDPATGYPVRIESVKSGLPRSESIMTKFEINIDLPESLFDMTSPPGYKVLSFDLDVPKPSEQRLVDGFRTAIESAGGEFPESMDSAGLLKVLEKFKAGAKGGQHPSDQDLQRRIKTALTIGNAYEFALDLPASADAHYAGKGVKRDTPNRAIFWYKPEGTSKYHVIFADLSVKVVDNAPQVPGATRIEKASKATTPAAK